VDRAILLALLGVPILVILHIALFRQPVPMRADEFWAAAWDGDRIALQGHWQSPEQTVPPIFVVERTTQRGS
jgi:hypothetical protein